MTGPDAAQHIPVLLHEVIDGLALQSGDTVVDCTLGFGGHTNAILDVIGPSGRILAFDRDPSMIERAKHQIGDRASQVTFVHANFADLGIIAPEQGFAQVQGLVADLGLSSIHIDTPERGFSFRLDGPLDMRFDPHGGRESARDIVNQRTAEELQNIFQTYGEERFARRIANKIALKRTQKEITTTRELAEIIVSCVPPQKHKLHPATKVFQALRIYINDELGALTRMLRALPTILVPGRRAAIISFHSLEDRYIKTYFKSDARSCTHTHREQCVAACAAFSVITKKPIVPTPEEINRNPRARSAKLRIAERRISEN